MVKMTFREHIKEKLNMSIKDFSRLAGESDRTLYNWYHGKKRMLIDLIIDGIKWRNR